MPLLNIVAAMGLGWIGAVWAVHQGRPASWGFYLPCGMVPGIAVVLNLTDAVAALTLTCMVLAYLRRIDIWVGPLAQLMLLAKEQNALVLVLTGGLALYARRWIAIVGLSFAGVLWCGWLFWIWASYDRSWPFIPASGNFASPGYGIYWRLTHLGHTEATDCFSTGQMVIQGLSMLYQIFLAGFGLWLACRSKESLIRAIAAGERFSSS